MRETLFTFSHIFTQDVKSISLLKTIGFTAATKTGDTRLDRVWHQLSVDNHIDFLDDFTNDKKVIIFGSSWPEDEALFIPFINENSDPDLKFIIAPHEFKGQDLARLKERLKVSYVLYSEMESGMDLSACKVFILNTIGYLSRAYSYAKIAYIGGAAGKTGLHNVLEPSVFGIPVIIGPHYKKFPEAEALKKNGGLTVVSNSDEFSDCVMELLGHPEKLTEQGACNFNFVKENRNSTARIMKIIGSEFSG